MLEGLEISEVHLSDIDLGDRIDADYFTKENIQIEKELKDHRSTELRNLANFVASAFYPAATQLYEIGDTPFIRCVDCINYPLITKSQDNIFENIPMSFVKDNKGISLLNKNDIVITKVGSPCFASLVYEHDVVALSRTVMGLKDIHGVNPFYLLAFLRSKFGLSQLMRARELTIQYQLTLERVKRILVYLPSFDIQTTIESVIKQSIEKQIRSQALYTETEEFLLSELGLKDWQPKNENVSLKRLSDFASSGRLDAEYYQSKYDEIENVIKSYKGGYFFFGETIEYIFTGEYSEEYKSKADDLIFYIRSLNIKNGTIEKDNSHYVSPAIFKKVVKTGNIITSRVGTIGVFAEVDKSLNNAACSDNVLCFNLPNQYNPAVYTMLLNSKPIFELVDRLARGSVQQRLNQETLKDLILPIIPETTQSLIAEKIQKSFDLRKQSKLLLEQARRMVEEEIEK